MLQSLHIQNYALIDHLDIEFENGFSVITGETGAGKSILLGAIGLLLGQRADIKMIKTGKSRCIIEANFDLSYYNIKGYFENHDIDFDGSECIIRRELTSTGKTRAFINDNPTSLSNLKELGEQLIDVHSQHQNLLLNKEDFQRRVLDDIADCKTVLTLYEETYKRYLKAQEELEIAKTAFAKGKEEQDYIAFQLHQLQEAKLSEDEETELEHELSTLEHAEDIKSTLYQSLDILDREDAGIVNALRETERKLNTIANFYALANELSERLQSCYIEVRDIADEISNQAEQVDFDPERLAFVNERISTIHNLKQKFHKENVTELLAFQQELAEQLSLVENSEEQLQKLEQDIKHVEKELNELAQQLTAKRKRAAKNIEKEMCKRLVPLAMPNVQFHVEVSPLPSFGLHGHDRVTFLFSANKNIPVQPISQIASGGEVSRVMLALKAMISGFEKLPTIIFDEIDTGVSGHIAEQMAKIMKEMGEAQHRQVISITHLPQIAAMGNQHYRVFKEETSDTTSSHIVRLQGEERIGELARMLSGSVLTKAAIENARELLEAGKNDV